MQIGYKSLYVYDTCFRASIYLVYPKKGELTKVDIQTFLSKTFSLKYDLGEVDFNGKCLQLDGLNNGAHVIFLRKWKRSAEWVSTLVHECFHATEQILDDRGVKYTVDQSNEAFAYLQESIVIQFLQRLKFPL